MSALTFSEQRRKSLGGTDIAAICGINPYKTAFDVYEEKIEGREVIKNDAMRLGNAFESGIAELFAEDSGLKLFSPQDDIETFRAYVEDKNVEFVKVNYHGKEVTILKKGIGHGSLDYFTIDHEGKPAVVECKLVTNNFFKSKEEFIKTNPHYYMQTQWYMYITGFRKAYFATVQFQFGGHIEWYPVDYNEVLVEKMIFQAEKFWNNHIKLGIKPNPSNPDELNRFIEFNTDEDYAIATEDIFESYNQLVETRERLKNLETTKKFLEDKIKMAIYDKNGLMSPDNSKTLATYKVQTRVTIDSKRIKSEEPDLYEKYSKESQSRTFLLK
jgi:putative phage-type endonuclease